MNFSKIMKICSNYFLTQHPLVLIKRMKKSFSRSPEKYKKYLSVTPLENPVYNKGDVDNVECTEEDFPDDYEAIVKRTFRVSSMGHNVLVIQPYIKWGPEKKTNTTPHLQLDEAVALIRTLKNWNVVDQMVVPLLSFDKSSFFGEGSLDTLRKKIKHDETISAVFISVNILKGRQRSSLESIFEVPIFDRYSIVIQILREHAITADAKLQIELAEIPYLRGRLRSATDQNLTSSLLILRNKEKIIRDEIRQLKSQRDLLRKKRTKLELPVVAVVGYTNAGKTCLIKALTGEESIVPQDYLFATLDVTMHAGVLPSSLKVLYADTIGFMSDLPAGLLECFTATLEDALLADVIVHVRDASHPDTKAQNELVLRTLGQLIPEDMNANIITVANKIDKVSENFTKEFSNCFQVSALKGSGLIDLALEIERRILLYTNRLRMVFKVRQSGPEYQWLRTEATVCSENPDPQNPQITLLECIISESALAKFKHRFIYCVNK